MNAFSVVVQAIFVLIASLITLRLTGKSNWVLRKVEEFAQGKPGCAPVNEVGNVTLHYFNIRGKAEGIRLLLEEAEIPHKQVLVNDQTWPEYKKAGIKSGLYTFGQVPAIETTSGLQLVQSHSIMQYLGRATGMQCDCQHLHLCDILSRGIEDAGSKYTSFYYNTEFCLADLEDYLNNILPMWMAYFEKLAPALAKQDRAFFYSDRLTWVDFVVFDWLETNVNFAQFDFGPKSPKKDVLEDFPKLNNFYKQFAVRPRMAKYINSKKRLLYSPPRMPIDA